jgi:hypothetical protein
MTTQGIKVHIVLAMLSVGSLAACKSRLSEQLRVGLDSGSQIASLGGTVGAPFVGIRVQRTDKGLQFWFAYRDVRASEPAPRIQSAAIDSLSSHETVCEMRAERDGGLPLDGAWTPGTTPPGFWSQGCRELDPGEYEIYVEAAIGQGRQRFMIEKDGSVRLLPWGDEKAAAEAAKLFDSLVEQSEREHQKSRQQRGQ